MMKIGSIESGNLTIKVLTTNTVISTLVTDQKFQGKVIQPQINATKLIAEHGLAMSIEITNGEEKEMFLLDASGPRKTILENAAALSIDFTDFNKLILSHGHTDHYGGLIGVLPKLKKGCEFILSPNCYEQNMLLVPKSGEYYSPEVLTEKFRELNKQNMFILNLKMPMLNKKLIENLTKENDIKIVETTTPLKLSEGMITSGEIELFDENETTKGLYLMKNRKEFVKHRARDEISIYINIKDKGLVVITGCGHAGIVNTIKHGQKLTGVEKIYAVIGGFHKEWESTQDIEETVKFIENLNPEITCGMHCTGFEFNRIMARHDSHTLGITGTEFHL